MNKREWIRANRDEIDRIIYARPGMDRDRFKLNDDERADWLANDERLYLWAHSEGVNV